MDRNIRNNGGPGTVHVSLSARRAWIEIYLARNGADNGNVALRKESVDRNNDDTVRLELILGRSPQGERG